MTFDKKAYQRAYMQKKRGKEGKVPLDSNELISNELYEYDREKYPNFKAWEIAVQRVIRAKRYALACPEHIRLGDEKYRSVEWQYEHEGLPSVRRKETHLVT